MDIAASVIAAVPIPMVLIDSARKLTAVNPQAEALLGPGATGRHYMTVLRQPSLVTAIEAALAGQGRGSARHAASEAGRETAWRVTATPLEGGLPGGVAVSFEDVTPLDEAMRSRRDFVANVSHELRTPLTALIGFIETLKGAARDDRDARERFLGVMEREAGRMSRLVADLTSLSRVEAEERVRPTASVALGPVIERCASALRPLALDAGAAIEVELPEAPVAVPGDADQLQQVFTNLMENALKYGASGGRVLVALSRSPREPRLRGPAARVEVIDWGEGFDPIHIPRLTERFYRVDGHRSRERGGTGLGLAIVKHIVNRHRGVLRIDGAPGRGSRFTVLLPLAEPAPAPTPPAAALPAPRPPAAAPPAPRPPVMKL